MQTDTTISPAHHAAIGAVQGLALWALYESVHNNHWPPGSAPWIWCLAYALLIGPLAWQLLPGVFASEARRVACAVGFGLVFALLGAHAGAQVDGDRFEPTSYLPVAAILAFVLIGLVAGWNRETRRLDYSRHFDAAWRNGLMLPLAAALTLLLWALLWAGAMLMQSIGLDGLRQFLEKTLTEYVVSATSFSWVLGMGLARPATLMALRRFVLSIVTWLLPLALALAFSWLVALPFTGVAPLFATRNAANYLFWFSLLSIAFMNASFQDGHEAPAFAPRLARVLAFAWLCLPPLALLGDWALGLRVAQHGWTTERIWAAYVGLILTLYALGYASSLIGAGPWMRRLPRTNWIVCVLGCALAVALISPVADVHRLAVQSQLSRLTSGAVSADKFDWASLGRQGRYGHDALKAVAAAGGENGRLAQVQLNLIQGIRDAAKPMDAAALTARLDLLPQGQKAAPGLLDALTKQPWRMTGCSESGPHCVLWLADLNGDGQQEALLITPSGNGASILVLLKNSAGVWDSQNRAFFTARKGSLDDWRRAIQAGTVKTVPPRLPDLELDGERIELR
jgi:hypothetical protein